jgi:hypothetical protein
MHATLCLDLLGQHCLLRLKVVGGTTVCCDAAAMSASESGHGDLKA